MSRAVIVAIAALSIGAFPVGAQRVAAKPLARANGEVAEPFSGVLDVRELSDGRLVVLDAKDNLLYWVSADLGTVKAIGREGSGPTEYRRITQIVRRGADTTLAYDVMNARFLVISPSGAALSTLSLREASGGLPVGPMSVRGYDASGRLLYQGLKVSMTKDGPALSDTAPILRLDPARKAVDTLALVRIGSPGMKMSGDVQKGGGSVRLTVPAYPVVDEWGLLPDGRVVVVRGGDYRLEFVTGPGAVTSRGPVAYERVKVTDADKAELKKQRDDMQKEIAKAMAGARASLPAGKGQGRLPTMAMDEPTSWPAVKPAFGQGALKVAPDGELWISRLRAAKAPGQSWDVFTSAGVLRLRVEVPGKVQLVSIGATHVYSVRVDEDGLQVLQRHPRP